MMVLSYFAKMFHKLVLKTIDHFLAIFVVTPDHFLTIFITNSWQLLEGVRLK